MAILPVVRGLLVCERVEADPVSTNLTFTTASGVFAFRRYRAGQKSFFVVTSLVNVHGTVCVRTTISAPLSTEVCFSHSAEIAVPDRLTEVRFVLQVFCRFNSAGSFDISLQANGELIALTPFRVHLQEADKS